MSAPAWAGPLGEREWTVGSASGRRSPPAGSAVAASVASTRRAIRSCSTCIAATNTSPCERSSSRTPSIAASAGHGASLWTCRSWSRGGGSWGTLGGSQKGRAGPYRGGGAGGQDPCQHTTGKKERKRASNEQGGKNQAGNNV